MDAVAYRNGQKNNWRSRAWNTLHEFVGDRRDAIVLYLPGSEDLDRSAALRHGFDSENMIAVEFDAGVAKCLRARSVNTIHGSLGKVCESWPAHTRVSALIADFQCGIEKEVLDVLGAWLYLEAFRDCTLILNLQRGRDKVTKLPTMKWIQELAKANIYEGGKATNRSLLMLMFLCSFVAKEAGIQGHEALLKYFRVGPLHSYKSSKVFMDSIALLKRSTPPIPAGFETEKLVDAATRRRISAALAVRTLRLSARMNSTPS